jgi:hypothetical protein
MLERVYKSVAQFLNDLIESSLTLLRVLLQSRNPEPLPLRQNAVCSVLGNGPSLSDTLQNQLDFLKKTEIVCVNNFAHSPYFVQLQPQNYVIVDPNYFVFNEQSTDRPDIRQTLDAFCSVVNWPMTLYVPRFAKDSYVARTIASGNPNIRLVFVNHAIARGFAWFRHWLYQTGWGMMQSQTVIVAALFLMINRRFDAIYLFGADQSWHEQIRLDDGKLVMQQLHFYEKDKDVAYLPVYTDKHRTKTDSMANQFLSLHKAFRGYEVLREYADSVGVRIFNASSKSYIDALERVKISGSRQEQ